MYLDFSLQLYFKADRVRILGRVWFLKSKFDTTDLLLGSGLHQATLSDDFQRILILIWYFCGTKYLRKATLQEKSLLITYFHGFNGLTDTPQKIYLAK